MSNHWLAFFAGAAILVTISASAPASAQTAKPGWELTFDDEFTGTAVDATKWLKRYKWGEAQINGELQAYVDDAFQLDGNVLHIVGQKAPGQYANSTFDYRSGLIASVFHQTYGWFEIRCKMPAGQGFWPAFWLLGETGTTGVNEIDIHEFLGNKLDTVYLTVHWGPSYTTGHQSDSTSYIGPDFSADFHTFAVDWDVDRIIWYIDGVEQFRHTGVGVPQVEMYVIANLAIGGGWPGAPDTTTKFPSSYDIDYVRVYRRATGVGDAGAPDAGTAADAGRRDAGAPDASPAADAGRRDAGSDAGTTGNDTKVSGGAGTSCGCRLAGKGPARAGIAGFMLFAMLGLASRRRRGPRA